jgi:signal transduction histidine kinase
MMSGHGRAENGDVAAHPFVSRLLRPTHWDISTRSAVMSAAVVFIAVVVAGAGLVYVLYRTLLSSIDEAAAGRVRDIVAGLSFDRPSELDGALLTTDQRVVAVQIIGADNKVVGRSTSAPDSPLLPTSEFGARMRTGISDDASHDNDMRISGRAVTVPSGSYTVIVGGGSESAETTVGTVMVLMVIAAPVISVVAGAVSYRLVKRSLRSVEAIRARVAAISASDLTERVPVPVQNDEISALARTMNEMLERVEYGHAAQRRFVGDASHELRSPLASIISALEVAQAYPDELDDELRTGILIPEAYRMQDLVDDLLLLTRADERGLTVRNDEVHLEELAREEALRLKRETTHKISVRRSEDATVLGDPGGLARVLRNLLDNAVQHTKSLIEIDIQRQQSAVIVAVSDDGPGIPPGDRQRAFDRFVRLDSARTREGGGSGLGLSIVAEIVTAHNGTVQISDRPGGGTRVSIRLPAPRANQPAD